MDESFVLLVTSAYCILALSPHVGARAASVVELDSSTLYLASYWTQKLRFSTNCRGKCLGRRGGRFPTRTNDGPDESFDLEWARLDRRAPGLPVELIGIEPTTSGLQSPRSPS
jgi:hypothetical protein